MTPEEQRRCERYCHLIGALESTLREVDRALSTAAGDGSRQRIRASDIPVLRAEIAERLDEIDALFPRGRRAP